MIICRERGFAYYHIPKTGGSAITWGLAKAVPELPDPPPAEEIYGINSKKHALHGWQWKYHCARHKGSVMHGTFDTSIKDLFIFTFYRNPYDRAVSLYRWGGIKSSFKDFMRRDRLKKICQQQILFCHPEWVSTSGSFENLNDDFKDICKIIGVKAVDLPVVQRHHEPIDYRDYYDEETKEMMKKHYVNDIELLGYDFDGY